MTESSSIDRTLRAYRRRSKTRVATGQWTGYAAATTAAFAGSHVAEGAVQYVAPADPKVADAGIGASSQRGRDREPIDIDGDGQDDIALAVAYDIAFGGFASVGALTEGRVEMLTVFESGDPISGGEFEPGGIGTPCCLTLFKQYYGFYRTNISTGDATFDPELIGFALIRDDQPYYGWIRIELGDPTAFGSPRTATALEWAYQTAPGLPIAAGARVPEPTG